MSLKKIWFFLLVLFFCHISSNPALAFEDTNFVTLEDSLNSMEIQSIVVTGRRLMEDQSKVIGNVGQILEEEIDRISHSHISQVTARVPGVWISRGLSLIHI